MYLADQVSRARSGFDPSSIIAVRQGTRSPESAAERFSRPRHQVAWTGLPLRSDLRRARFRTDSSRSRPSTSLYKQMIPDLNAHAAESQSDVDEHGGARRPRCSGAVLMGHSESGFFPEQAALLNADPGIKGTDLDRDAVRHEPDAPARS